MAIVIKVKADTKEFEKDVKDAANRAKKSVESVTAGGTGGGGLGKISDEFKRMRTEGEALRTRLDALRQGNVNLQGSLGGTLTRLTALTGGVTALATAAAAAATGIVAMGKAGSVAAQGLLELSRKQEITIEQTQQLVIRTKDYSERLSTLGGILSNQVVKGAADAFNEFEVLDRQFTAVQITIADRLGPGLDALAISLQHALQSATPLGIALADDLAGGMRTAARDIEATAREFSFLQSIFDQFSVNNIVRELQRLREEQLGATPQRFTDIPVPRPPASSTRNILGLTGAQTYQQFGRQPTGRAPRAPRAAREPNIPFESVDALRILNQVLSQLEENAKGAAVGIAAMNARTLQVLEGRARLRAQQEDIPTFTAEQAGLTTGVDESRIRAQIIQADLEKQFQVFEEVRQQAIRFKEGIVYTFESAFREGFEKGPKAFLQATAAAIKSFFSQIAAELSTGIIELILFGKGGITGRGVGTSGTLGGLGAALGGFGGGGGGGGGGGFLGGILGNFGGLGGGTFGGSIFGGGAGGGGISVAPSLSGAVGGFSGFSGGFGGVSNAVAQQLGFGGAGGAASGGLFGGLLGAVAGPALLGGLLGTGLGGKSLGGKILGGIGGGIAGIGVGLGAAVGLAGGGLLAGALAATGFGLLAAPFIIGAVLLGKAKQRKVDEQAADAIWVAEREQIRTLISAVNADRIEGYDALAQWSQLRSQTVSQLNQIKTQSVRESRLTNQLRDLDNGVVAELRAAVERQARRRGVSGMLVPEFEAGGRVPGVDRGYDSVMIKARPGEVVLNRQQQASIQARAGDRIFEEVGIQSFQYGGRVSAAPQVPQSLHLTISLEGDAQAVIGNLIVRGVETSSGQRAIVSVVKNGRKNGEL